MYIAGQVLKNSLANFPNKVDDQEKIANEKAKTIYEALEKYPESYKIVPDKSARSRMNICFRVTHVRVASKFCVQSVLQLCTNSE